MATVEHKTDQITPDELANRVVDEDASLAVRRLFTIEGRDPFDEVDWEIRDAHIPGKNGPTFEQKNVNLKLDKFTAGPYSLVVMGQDDSNRNIGQAGGTQVILFHQGPLRDVKKIAFIGPDGQEIQARVSGSGQSGSVHHTYYSLAKKVETCTIRITGPESVETVSMAVEINTGIGVPAGARRRILPAPDPRPTAADAPPR